MAHGDLSVSTHADVDLWRTICDGVNGISERKEAVFEFDDDHFEVSLCDASNVAMTHQIVDAGAFDDYHVDEPFDMGVDTERLDDLLKIVGAGEPVRFGWDTDDHRFAFRAADVEYDLAGISVDAVGHSPHTLPGMKDTYDVHVDAPASKLTRAVELADMTSDYVTFTMGGDDGAFVMEGKGDTDVARVTLHTDDDFEWARDPPESPRTVHMGLEMFKKTTGLLPDEPTRFITGDDFPYRVRTDRGDGRVATQIIQAPRLRD